MQELNDIELAQVSGGLIPLVIGGLILLDTFIWGAVAGKALAKSGW